MGRPSRRRRATICRLVTFTKPVATRKVAASAAPMASLASGEATIAAASAALMLRSSSALTMSVRGAEDSISTGPRYTWRGTNQAGREP